MEQCPCGSGKNYSECCEPLIKGKLSAKTAEELMRSRYSAYVKKEIAYIIDTILPEKQTTLDEQGIRRWSENAQWQKLQILNTEDGGQNDAEGKVEFIAHYIDKGQTSKHHEIGKFTKYNDRWYYNDAEIPAPQQVVRTEPKVKRNDPCSCGSGKKFKKCCGRQS
jgi:SEC-C motif-containing protein